MGPHEAIRLSELASRGAEEMSVRHASLAGKIARAPRSPLPFPSAVKVTDDPVIDAVTAVARKVLSSVQCTLACPLASVSVVVASVDPFPLAVLQDTCTPAAGAPCATDTVTTSGAASLADNVPCCASPLVFAMT